MVMFQSVQGHTALTHHFSSFYIRALWRSGLSARVPECLKLKGGLEQCGAEYFGGLIISTIRKCVGLKRLMTEFKTYMLC